MGDLHRSEAAYSKELSSRCSSESVLCGRVIHRGSRPVRLVRARLTVLSRGKQSGPCEMLVMGLPERSIFFSTGSSHRLPLPMLRAPLRLFEGSETPSMNQSTQSNGGSAGGVDGGSLGG